LLPLKKIHLPFTVAIMLFGMILGTGVKLYTNWNSSTSIELSIEKSNVYSNNELTQIEDQADQPTDHHNPFKSILHDIISVLSALGNNLTPQLIFFIVLPILVFESAHNMELREVFKNILPITILALPGLLLSTFICGAALVWGGASEFGLSWSSALLFGALISATDPVAVVALFKDFDAPKQLGVLVEGESLFNDGTAIVLFNILLVFVLGASESTSFINSFGAGFLEFLRVSFGGIFIGLILALLAWNLIGRIVDVSEIEISLTLVLAYLSFIIAEHTFHVSGVMATVVAGLVTASYSRTKLSPSVSGFMHKFWEYLAFVMNSLIFFIVGLVITIKVDLAFAISLLPLLGIALIALIVARAVSVFGSFKLTKRFTEKVDFKFQAVIFWGGLRGAIGLALALTVATYEGIPEIVQQTILTLSGGVVLFTLLVNALTIEALMKWLKLDRPSVIDQFTLAHSELAVCEELEKSLIKLEKDDINKDIIQKFRNKNDAREKFACDVLEELRQESSKEPGQMDAVATMVALAVEKREILSRYKSGSLTEHTTNKLLRSVDKLQDSIKHKNELPSARILDSSSDHIFIDMLSNISKWLGFKRLSNSIETSKLKREININRGMFLTSRGVDSKISKMEDSRTVDLETLGRLQARYFRWELNAQQNVELLADKYPELTKKAQELIAEYELLCVEQMSISRQKDEGLMTQKAWSTAHENIVERKKALHKHLGESF